MWKSNETRKPLHEMQGATNKEEKGEQKMNTELKKQLEEIRQLPLDEKILAINEVKALLKQISPFNAEPVECVQWVKADKVIEKD